MIDRKSIFRNSCGFLIGLVVCILLALGSLFLLFALRDRSQLEDCFMQGRTNCVPLDPAPAGK